LGASPRTPPRRRPVPADEQAPPKGRVISIAGDGKTVIISLGSEQGVRPGSRYTVARGPSYVGTVEVTAVRATQSTARVLEHLQKSPIRPGDVVIR